MAEQQIQQSQQSQQQTQSQQSQQSQQEPDYYRQFTNANLFISNNANPFLISPYAPNQVNGRQATLVTLTNTIKPYTPSGTIQILGNMNVNGFSLSINNSPLFANQINSLPSVGAGVSVSCISDIDPRMEVEIGGSPVFTVNATGMGLPSTTLIGAAGASVGYVPIFVGGVEYRLQIFNV